MLLVWALMLDSSGRWNHCGVHLWHQRPYWPYKGGSSFLVLFNTVNLQYFIMAENSERIRNIQLVFFANKRKSGCCVSYFRLVYPPMMRCVWPFSTTTLPSASLPAWVSQTQPFCPPRITSKSVNQEWLVLLHQYITKTDSLPHNVSVYIYNRSPDPEEHAVYEEMLKTLPQVQYISDAKVRCSILLIYCLYYFLFT